MRLAVEVSAGLKIVRTRCQMVSGRKGTITTHSTAKAGISLGFHKNTSTTMPQAMPTQLARE